MRVCAIVCACVHVFMDVVCDILCDDVRAVWSCRLFLFVYVRVRFATIVAMCVFGV